MDTVEILTIILLISASALFVLSGKLTHITDEAESQLQISKSIVSDIRDRTDKILNMETKIRNSVEDTVMPIVKNINAVGVGVGAFWRKLRNK